MPVLDPATGLLPIGRFNVTLDEVKRYYVDDAQFAASTTRAEIWSHFEVALEWFRSITPVVCVWIGGSFLTCKVDPDDIDLVYWCLDTDINEVTGSNKLLALQYFADNEIRAQTGLRVDTRYCVWRLNPEADRVAPDWYLNYVTRRGYWDDFWMRKRSGAKGDPPVLADALPKRGYLEVSLDGFHGI
jgi:hypothetical protein